MPFSGSDAPTLQARERGYYETFRRLRWPNGIACPRCGSGNVGVHSRSSTTPSRKYRCHACERLFTDFTGTPFAGTNLPLGTWCLYLRLMEQGHTTVELAKELGVKWDTAASLQRRIALVLHQPGLMQQLRKAVQRETAAGTS